MIKRGNLVLYRMTPSIPFHICPLPIHSRLNLVKKCILNQFWSPMKRKRKRKWIIRSNESKILTHTIIIINNIQDISKSRGGDRLPNRQFSLRRTRDFHLDLEWPWKTYRWNDLSTFTNTIYWFVATLSLIVGGRTYGRTDGWTDIFFSNSLGHLSWWAEMTKHDWTLSSKRLLDAYISVPTLNSNVCRLTAYTCTRSHH